MKAIKAFISVIKTSVCASLCVILTCLTVQATVMADGNKSESRCDVVSINGSGQLLADGRIVGKELISIVGVEKQSEVEFTATTLGFLNVDQATGSVNLAASHDFTGTDSSRLNFTTFDDITIVPLGGFDASCTQNACGLIFKLKLETGHGRYNCGEIVSGVNPDPTAAIPFTSYVNPLEPAPNGGTVTLNSVGKLCKCSGHN